MKRILFSFTIFSFFTLFLTVTSCKNKSADQGKEYTSAYVCPMHCEGSGSESAGVCPVCGMDYVANESNGEKPADDGHNHDGHDHNHDHDGHDHSH